MARSDSLDRSTMEGSAAASKKSRAKSCTACRQVKLRCDIRDKYPMPCSRCTGRKLECRMDPNFKRVQAKSVPQSLTDDASTSEPSPTAQALPQHNLHGQSVLQQEPVWAAGNTQPHGQHTSLPDRSMPRHRDSLVSEKWLDLGDYLTDEELLSPYTIGNAVVDTSAIVDLYQHFQDFYYAHLPVFEPVISLQELHKESPTLFWAIAFTASRYHPHHAYLYALLREPFEKLVAGLLLSSVQHLKDLQALLIICHWPFEVNSQWEDPSWMHVGFVISSSLYMDLDKTHDDVVFRLRGRKNSSELSDIKYRKRTWLKIFQISTQIATWHGLRPHITSARALQQLQELCEGETNRELVATTEIQYQMTRNTTSLNEFGFHGPQVTILDSMIQDLDGMKRRFADVNSDTLTINLEAARLYTLEHCLILADEQIEAGSADAEHFLRTALQIGHSSALRLIEVIKSLGVSNQPTPFCGTVAAGGVPLLSHPKQHFRLAFYACLFLLKYLDHSSTASSADQDAARNAIVIVYQIFKQFQSLRQLVRGARTVEVLGRSIVPGQRRLKAVIKTRMGGSLNFNAVWLASQLRGREDDTAFVPRQEVSEVALVYAQSALIAGEPSITASENDSFARTVPIQQPEVFPWGVWNDDLCDELGIVWNEPFLPTFSGTRDPF